MPVVDELITFLGFEADSKELDKAKDSMKSLKSGIQTGGLAIAGFVTGFAYMTKEVMGGIDTNARFAKTIGISYEKFQEWDYAVKQAGGSMSEFQGDMSRLAQSGKPISETMGVLSKELEGMTEVQGANYVKALGYSDSLFQVLKQGPEGVKKAMAEARASGAVVDESAVKEARKFQSTLDSVTSSIEGTFKSAIVGIAPVLTELLTDIKEWIGSNQELIKTNVKDFVMGTIEGIKMFAAGVKAVIDVVKKVTKYLEPFIGETDKVGTIAVIVAGLLTTVVVAAVISVISSLVALYTAMAPLLPVFALLAIAAAGFWLASEGNPWLSDLLGITDQLKEIYGWFLDIEGLKEKGMELEEKGLKRDEYEDLIKTASVEKDTAKKKQMIEKAEIIREQGIKEGYFDKREKTAAQAVERKIQKRQAAQTETQQESKERTATDLKRLSGTEQSEIRPAPMTETRSAPSNTNNTSNNSNMTQTINVNGAKDPKAVAAEVAKITSEGMSLQTTQPGTRAPARG